MTFRTRLPELKFDIDEATILSVLAEWVRETYELGQREYNLDFVKSAIDGKYYVTATFIEKEQQHRIFTEVAKDSVDTQFPPFTIRQPYAEGYTSPSRADSEANTDEQGKPGNPDNGVRPPEV